MLSKNDKIKARRAMRMLIHRTVNVAYRPFSSMVCSILNSTLLDLYSFVKDITDRTRKFCSYTAELYVKQD